MSPPHSHLTLVGLMGSGKSTVGRLVADAAGIGFVDVDDAIRERTGRSVEELWREGGEAAYRPLELDVLVEALDPARPAVLAAPGGAVDDPGAVAALGQDHVGVVYLRAEPALLAERVRADPQPRPLLGTDPERVLADQHARRDERYASLADVVVSITDRTPEQVAEEILATGVLELGGPSRANHRGST